MMVDCDGRRHELAVAADGGSLLTVHAAGEEVLTALGGPPVACDVARRWWPVLVDDPLTALVVTDRGVAHRGRQYARESWLKHRDLDLHVLEPADVALVDLHVLRAAGIEALHAVHPDLPALVGAAARERLVARRQTWDAGEVWVAAVLGI